MFHGIDQPLSNQVMCLANISKQDTAQRPLFFFFANHDRAYDMGYYGVFLPITV